ncbi:hypothetical protein [Polynucleobacter sp. UB-Tiil-W10]|nr:hypothetical protein [Polynucleobacter sp. UB-Tiil-W10]MBU3541417.1 hypothetical protein [Polynucleobacter sp. UB-Tiil-W10]
MSQELKIEVIYIEGDKPETSSAQEIRLINQILPELLLMIQQASSMNDE